MSHTAAAAFSIYALTTFASDPRRVLDRWLDPRLAGLPALSLGWLAYSLIDFDHWPDMIPLSPLVAFWAAWLIHRVSRWIEHRSPIRTRPQKIAARALEALAYSALALYAVIDAFTFRMPLTLSEQVQRVDEITADIGEGEVVFATNMEEVYVLSERASPLPALRLPLKRFIDPERELQSCAQITAWLDRLQPAVVVTNQVERPLECPETGERLIQRGYEERSVQFTSVTVRRLTPSTWRVFTRRPRTAPP